MLRADRLDWFSVAVAWMLGAFGSAALLAWLYRKLYPELSFYKLWAFWTVVVSVIAAGVFAFGLV